MHTMDAGWPHLQVAGITNTLKEFGVEVVGVTDAKFNVGQQISDLEQMTARKPDVIFSIPIDPKSQAEAYKKAAAAGIKLVFLDNVPVGMTPGKDYVSVVASDNEKNAYYAADELAKALDGKGEVGIITLVYDYYYSVAARKVGAMKAFEKYPGIKMVGVGTIPSPEKAYEVATSMLTANPDLKGFFVAWDTPGAADRLGRQDARPRRHRHHQRHRRRQRRQRRPRRIPGRRRPAALRPGRRRSQGRGARAFGQGSAPLRLGADAARQEGEPSQRPEAGDEGGAAGLRPEALQGRVLLSLATL